MCRSIWRARRDLNPQLLIRSQVLYPLSHGRLVNRGMSLAHGRGGRANLSEGERLPLPARISPTDGLRQEHAVGWSTLLLSLTAEEIGGPDDHPPDHTQCSR